MIAKRALVTGASGFIGQPLVGALVRSGFTVRAATRRPVSFSKEVDVAFVPDFSSPIDWKSILRNIDIVIHAAGSAHADQSTASAGAFDADCKATRELAEAAARAGVERFLYISSVRAQTGPFAANIVSEDDKPHPTDWYGRSKLLNESAVRAAGVKFTILRPVVVYGPRLKGNFKSVVELASSPLALPFAGLNTRRSLLEIDNLISAILFVLTNPTTEGETYLVADSKSVTIREIFAMLRKAQGRRPRLIHVPPELFHMALKLINRAQLWERLGKELVVDTSKLESLGWRPPVETYDGFRAMLSAEKGHPTPQAGAG